MDMDGELIPTQYVKGRPEVNRENLFSHYNCWVLSVLVRKSIHHEGHEEHEGKKI
jgi:hypothetical protein